MKKINFGLLAIFLVVLSAVTWQIYWYFFMRYMDGGGPDWINQNFLDFGFVFLFLGFICSILGFLLKQYKVVSLICLVFSGSLLMLKLFLQF